MKKILEDSILACKHFWLKKEGKKYVVSENEKNDCQLCYVRILCVLFCRTPKSLDLEFVGQ